MFSYRISPEAMLARHGGALQALRAADFLSAIRLAADRPDIRAAALAMAGNEAAGLDAVPADCATPVTLFVAALASWLTGGDAAADRWSRRLAAVAPSHPGIGLLAAARGAPDGPLLYYTTSAVRNAFADRLKRSFGTAVTVVGHNPGQVDICIGIDTPPEALARVLGAMPKLVLIDQLSILPRAILQLPAPKVALTTDIEFYWAARGGELDAIDVILTGNSGDHAELGYRTGTQILQRVAALTDLPEAPFAVGLAATPRPIDLLATGSIDGAFFPDKHSRYTEATRVADRHDVRLLGRAFDRPTYFGLLAQAKFALTSSRASHALLGRQVDALVRGTLVLAPEHSALPLLLDSAECGLLPYRDGRVARDVEAALAAYPAHRDAFDQPRRLLAPHSTAPIRAVPPACCACAATCSSWRRWCAAGCAGRRSWTARRRVRAPARSEAGCAVVKFVHLTGYQGPHRATLLRSAVRATVDGPPAMPQVAERIAAAAYAAIGDASSHLLRLQDAGRARVRGRVMQALNRARKATPDSLAVWFEIGRFLLARNRHRLAERVLAAIADGAAPTLDRRPYLIGLTHEFDDFPSSTH
ncbi:MAG: hypothetical protein R3F55_04230 [Alphaproteobacteria bacterium]